jgi:hypothetical protein
VSGTEKIGEILSSNIPKELLLHVWESFPGALERAAAAARIAHSGHRSSVAGLMRHFNLNEALEASFEAVGIPHEAIRGNRIMFGSVGIATVARVHMNNGPWDNSKRSVGKRKLCARNASAGRLLQPDFLHEKEETPLAEITMLLVTVGDGGGDDAAMIYVVVTNDEMDLKNPLFREPIDVFLQRYEQVVDVPDTAMPILKPGVQINPAESDESNY